MSSDLRDSGGIEQAADVVLFIYRDIMYKRDILERAGKVAEFIIAKNRHGPCGTVHCFFDAPTTRFYHDDFAFAQLVLNGEYSLEDKDKNKWLYRQKYIDASGDIIANRGEKRESV